LAREAAAAAAVVAKEAAEVKEARRVIEGIHKLHVAMLLGEREVAGTIAYVAVHGNDNTEFFN